MEISPFQRRMIAALSECPTCQWPVQETNGPEDDEQDEEDAL